MRNVDASRIESDTSGIPDLQRAQGAAGPTTEERDRIKALEQENRELRQADEILREASAYSALAEVDHRSKP